MGNLAYEVANGEYTPLSVCQEFYRNSSIDPGSETFNIDPHIEKGALHFVHLFIIYDQMSSSIVWKGPTCASIQVWRTSLMPECIYGFWVTTWVANNSVICLGERKEEVCTTKCKRKTNCYQIWLVSCFSLTECVSIDPLQPLQDNGWPAKFNLSIDFKRWPRTQPPTKWCHHNVSN